MSVYFNKEKGCWHFDFSRRIHGQRVRATKLLPAGWSRAQAEAFDRKESARLYAQATGLEAPSLSLAGAVQLYLDHHIPELKRGKQIAQDLAHLYEHIERASLQDAPAVALAYRKANPQLSRGTVWKRLCILKTAIRYAFKWHDYGDRDYSAKMIIPAPGNERQVYAKLKDLNRLWKAFDDPEARAMFRIAFYCGLRWRSELLPRKPEDIRRIDGEPWLLVGTTKNGTPRMAFCHPTIRADLKHLPFTGSDVWYYNRWRAATAKIGLKLHPHDLRHSLASEIVSRGGSLSDVAAVLHHQSLSSSKRYAHLYPERVRETVLGIGRKVTTPRPKRRVIAKV